MVKGNKQMKKIWYEVKRKMNIENTYFSWIGILSVFLIVGGFSFALFSIYQESRGSLNIITGNLYGYIDSESFENDKSILLKSEEERTIKITLKNVNEKEIKINLYYTETEGVEIYYLDEEEVPPKEAGIILEKEEEKTYRIRLINKTKEEKRVEFGSEVGLSSKELPFPEGKKIIDQYLYSEKILNGSDPVLKDRLIPVTIDPNGTVTYANVQEKWYKYEEKEWANAVILVDNPSNTDYKVGNQIEEKDIESYFVWIPRYKYELWNVDDYSIHEEKVTGNARTINIEFQNKEDKKEAGNQNGEYLTHPAFTLGEKELSGIWVGKFETGYNQTGDGSNPITTTNWTTNGAHKDEINVNRIIIKPNVYSWRNITVYKIFMNAYNYNRTLDSHMMKNTEWGAVAYLSHSNFGTNKEVNINNNSSFLTGYSAVIGTDQTTFPGKSGTETTVTQPYNKETGYLASTTGNISGIYDMDGGCHEYLATYMDQYGVKNVDNVQSGFSDSDLTQYKDYLNMYGSNSTETSYQNRILGDAIGEPGPFYYYKDGDNTFRYHNAWYTDFTVFIEPKNPWLHRGGYHTDGAVAGQFHFSKFTGGVRTTIGSRLTLAPK